MSGYEYANLIDAFEACEGNSIYWDIRSIATALNILRRNQEELVSIIAIYSNKDSISHFQLDRKNEMKEAMEEIIRLIHNYVASIKSLVDHTRRISKKVLTESGMAKYQQYIEKEFITDETTSFLQDLRNYLLHGKHPPIKIVYDFESEKGTVELESKELLKSKNWKATSRKFILNNNKSIVIQPLIDAYKVKIDDFYVWLSDLINTDRKADLDEFWQKHDAWVNWCRSNGVPVTQDEFKEFINERKTPPAPSPPG